MPRLYRKCNYNSITSFITGNKLPLSAFILIIAMGCRSHYPLATRSFAVVKTDDSYERGKNLVYNVCGECHYDYKGTQKFTGRRMDDMPALLGKIYSADLTDKGVLTTYTDAQLAYLLKTGISNKGKFIPYMIRPTMADKDLNDIIVYLHSNDEPLRSDKPSGNRTKVSAIGKIGIKILGKPTPDNRPIAGPDESNAVAYGRYLVDIMGCYHCHSKSIAGLDYLHPERSKGYLVGGMRFKMKEGKVYASNITPCLRTGIGKYTKEDFRKALHEKTAIDGRKLKAPMPVYPHLTNKQSDAIYAYLTSLPHAFHHIKGHPFY